MTKTTPAKTSPDRFAKPGKTSGVELNEAQLGKVQGGRVTLTDFNFVKLVDKSSPG